MYYNKFTMKTEIPDWKIIWLSSSGCMRALDGQSKLASRVIAVISGQQQAGIDDENTEHQKGMWEYLVQSRRALRPRYVLASANERITENFPAQKLSHAKKLWDDFWNEKKWINYWGQCRFKIKSDLDDDRLLFETNKRYESFWMENGTWYGQLSNWHAENISIEVTPQIDTFIRDNLFLFPDPTGPREIPTDEHWLFQHIYRQHWSSIWIPELEFSQFFSELHVTLQAALRYEMIRWTHEMKKIAKKLEQSKEEEQGIADIIRGVRAFDPINKENPIDTPEEFILSHWANW
jgi:hypothetical protein